MSKAFGEQNPTLGEDPVSWQTWSDGVGGIPDVQGNIDWGKLELDLSGEEGRSAVYDMGSAITRKYTLTENRYGVGSGSADLQIRGDANVFTQDSNVVDWEDYTVPISRAWRYVQVRESTFTMFFVDATLGDDGDPGTRAEPWQTIAKVNASSFDPGDNILFKAGETWRGEVLEVSDSGSVGHPITYGRYDTGANPIINPTLEYNDFVLDSGAIWKRNLVFSPLQVFEDNVRLTYHTDAGLSSGQWFWDSGASLLYVRCTDDGNPNTGHVVEHMTTNNAAFMFSSQSYINVNNIDITKAYAGYFWEYDSAGNPTNGSHNITVTDCTVSWCYFRGFGMGDYNDLDLNNILIDTCTIHDCHGEGIWMGNGSNIIARNCTVYNGKKDMAKFPVDLDSGGIICGIRAVNCVIEYCYVHDTYFGDTLLIENEAGYDRPTGIIVRRNHLVDNHSTDNFGVIGDEGSGTYIENNLVELTKSLDVCALAVGDGGTGAFIYHNTIFGNGIWLISINSGANHTIKNNILYDDNYGSLISVAGAGPIVGTVVNNNCYYSTGWRYYHWGTHADWNSFADWKTASGQDAAGMDDDPDFITPGTNHHLLITSPCRGAGVNVGVATDYDGVARPDPPAIGAYEYV